MSNVLADHFVLRLDKATSIDQAIKQWQGYGFQVHYGGQHIDKITSNALIVLADGLYIEILALDDNVHGAEKHRWYKTSPGWIDWAISPNRTTLQNVLSEFKKAGEKARYGAATPGGRDTAGPDPKHLDWETAMPEGQVGRLPFFCADVSPREWRVRSGTCRHPNQVVGVEQMIFLVSAGDVQNYSQSLSAVFGPSSPSADKIGLFETTSPGGGAVQILVRTADGQEELEWFEKTGGGFHRLVLVTEGEETEIAEAGISLKKRNK